MVFNRYTSEVAIIDAITNISSPTLVQLPTKVARTTPMIGEIMSFLLITCSPAIHYAKTTGLNLTTESTLETF